MGNLKRQVVECQGRYQADYTLRYPFGDGHKVRVPLGGRLTKAIKTTAHAFEQPVLKHPIERHAVDAQFERIRHAQNPTLGMKELPGIFRTRRVIERGG